MSSSVLINSSSNLLLSLSLILSECRWSIGVLGRVLWIHNFLQIFKCFANFQNVKMLQCSAVVSFWTLVHGSQFSDFFSACKCLCGSILVQQQFIQLQLTIFSSSQCSIFTGSIHFTRLLLAVGLRRHFHWFNFHSSAATQSIWDSGASESFGYKNDSSIHKTRSRTPKGVSWPCFWWQEL